MDILFEIESVFKVSNIGYFIGTRLLSDLNFRLTNNPRLGGVEITDWFDIPRSVDEKGRQRQGIFIFQFKNSEDREKLEQGQIVELTNEDEK